MARVLISGYYGFGNLGDELLLEAILRDVRRIDPAAEITVLSARPAETAARFGVPAVHRTAPLAVAQAVRRCDLLLSGGGTLLQDGTSRRSLWYYLAILALARRMGKLAMVYSQGLGPLTHSADRRGTRRALEGVQAITLRDRESGALLRELGVGRPFSVTADPVLSLALPGGERERRRIGWVLHGGNCDARLLDALEGAMQALSLEGYASVLLPFYPRQDLPAVRRLSRWATTVPPERVRGELDRCGRIVSMRLHGLILGGAGGGRVLALSEDPKLRWFLRWMKLPDALNPATVTAEELCRAVLHQAAMPDAERLEQAVESLAENERLLRSLLS